MNKRSNLLILTAVIVLLVSATAKAETFYAYLNGAQEAPSPVTTNATGYARVVLNETAMTINYTVIFNNLQGAQNNSHIHTGALAVSGPVTINFGVVGGASGTITGSAPVTAAQITLLRTHQFYVNVHSAAFGAGEIRGQLGIKRPVDFDGDGRQDYSILRFPAAAPQQITYYNRNSTAGDTYGVWGDGARDVPVPGDYDGDGKDDFAIYRAGATAGTQSEFYILRSSNNVPMQIAFGLNGDIPVNRDYDGDGITDLGIFRRGATAGAQANWWIKRSTIGIALSGNEFRVPFGTTGATANDQDVPVPGDYDGDGKFDIAVYRTGALSPANTFIVLRSSDSAVAYQQFGNISTDYLVPGDYDGDGKFDFAIARKGANGSDPLIWWILNSANSAVTTRQFGFTSDRPVQGDYDGDAKTDIAIYRAGATATSQSTFWVLRSFDGVAQPTQWGLGGPSTSGSSLVSDFPLATFDAR